MSRNEESPLPVLRTRRLVVRLAEPGEAASIAGFYRANKQFFREFEPQRNPEFYTADFWEVRIARNFNEFQIGIAVRLFFFKAESNTVVGAINFTSIERGPFQSCRLGYCLDKTHQGEGYMTEALRPAIKYVFRELNLHRISANYIPANVRSGKLLQRLGFRAEGISPAYLRINGEWKAHIKTALIHPDWIEAETHATGSNVS